MIHKVGKFAIDVEADIRTLVGILFQVCREQLKVGTRPIPLQQALRFVSDAMADPDGVGIRK